MPSYLVSSFWFVCVCVFLSLSLSHMTPSLCLSLCRSHSLLLFAPQLVRITIAFFCNRHKLWQSSRNEIRPSLSLSTLYFVQDNTLYIDLCMCIITYTVYIFYFMWRQREREPSLLFLLFFFLVHVFLYVYIFWY